MTKTVRDDVVAAAAYLDALFGTADDGHLAVWTAEDRRTAWFPVADRHGAAAAIAARSGAGLNVYVGLGLQAAPLGPWRRGGAATVVGVPGVWDDLDVAGPAHARTGLPPTRAAALALLASVPLRPSLLVDSGHGLYPLWLFREVWHFDDEEERRRAAALVARVQGAIRAVARRRGYDLETTGDLARVLRPVGALNRKPRLAPVLVRLVDDTGARYTTEEIEAVLPDEDPPPAPRRAWAGGAEPRADLARILAGCAYLRHCRDDAPTLDEPSWHALLSIVARCRDGERYAHALSSPYPAYDPLETDRKFAAALRENKPLRCATIRQERGGEPCCGVCPHWGRITSPVVLGAPSRSRFRIGRLVRPAPGPLRPGVGVRHGG